MSGKPSPSPTILTPTARLARAEKQRLALAHRSDGAAAWRAPSVFPFSSWLGRLRDDWFLVSESPRVPISASQALVIWQAVIDRDVFIGEPRVADIVAASWRLLQEYRIASPETWSDLTLSEDSRQFKLWAERFTERCEQRGLIDEWTFAQRLPDLIADGTVPLPESIRLSGFELAMTPLQEAILEAAESAGTRIERVDAMSDEHGPKVVDAFAEDDDELHAAARWARQWLETEPDQQVAVVVSGLRDRLGAVERIFRQVFDPDGFALESRRDEPWHISLGPALSRWSLVADALALLRIDPHRMSQHEAGALLRSPYLDGGESESRKRASTLCEIIRRRPYWLHAGQLAWQAGESGAKRLATRLGEWELLRRKHRDAATPSSWVGRFQKELEAIGFGRGRALDSREFQVLQRFHDLLEDFSALDVVVERPLPRAEAVRRLGERAAAASFRERNPGAPVEILGVEEALGSRFDAVRITGLDHRSWPAPPRRDAFIPARLQNGVPAASADAALRRARDELTGLMRTAPVVTASFSVGTDSEPCHLTPLLAGMAAEQAPGRDPVEPAPMDSLPEDRIAPEHPGGEVRGGTSVLQHQSNCPFRAFAEVRLGAGDLTPPRPGLDARDRGSLVHKALEHFWRDLNGLSALQALGDKALAERIAAAREAALEELTRRSPLALSEAGLAIEARCLDDALTDWLAIELDRESFTVTAIERPIEMNFGGLTLTGKIDRIDELQGGGALVIDYKTGASGKNGWAPEARLADVQLPAYAASLTPRPAALAFARLRPDAMGFDGLAEVDPGIAGLEIVGRIKGRSTFRETESWPSLVDEWRDDLDSLAERFRAGHAEVDPRDHQVCRYCHLHSLCRIHERRRALEADDE